MARSPCREGLQCLAHLIEIVAALSRPIKRQLLTADPRLVLFRLTTRNSLLSRRVQRGSLIFLGVSEPSGKAALDAERDVYRIVLQVQSLTILLWVPVCSSVHISADPRRAARRYRANNKT